jgi:hypothetical protein
MSPRSSARLCCLLGSFACLALHTASTALACDAEPTVRWVPERAWPSACEPSALTDGLVLLEGDKLPAGTGGGEGELHIVIERMIQGQVAETYPGKVTKTDSTSVLFKSDRALPAHADFQVSAQREAADGTPLSAKFTSAFTTGEAALPTLGFTGEPSLRLEQAEQERFDCRKDACGDEACKATGDLALVKSLRIAVPSIQGGVDLRSYAVSAQLVASASNGQAPVVATTDTTDTQPGKRSFLVLEVPSLEYASQGCVTITATDVAGHTVQTAPVCVALPADVGPAFGSGVQLLNRDDSEVAQSEAAAQEKADLDGTEYGTSTDALTETPASITGAQGCSVAPNTRASAGTLGWLALGLTVVRLRTRRIGKRS